MKMTSAYANKRIKSLEEDKAYWLNLEANSATYVCAVSGEPPVIPDYDYRKVSDILAAIDAKITVLKHAINVANANASIEVGDRTMSVDTILIRMAQLNRRKATLDEMRKRLPKQREEANGYMNRNAVAEYRYINYDLELVKADYEKVNAEILEMQMALDIYNQTVEFEVEV